MNSYIIEKVAADHQAELLRKSISQQQLQAATSHEPTLRWSAWLTTAMTKFLALCCN